MDLFDHLRELVQALNRESIPYALCGGLAMAVHGLVRATVDIDILVEESSIDSMKSIARQCGYAIDAGVMRFSNGRISIHRMTKIDPEMEDALVLDMLSVTPLLEPVWKSRFEVRWEDGPLWVVSREGLITMKKLRASGQDLDDIAFLKGEDDVR